MADAVAKVPMAVVLWGDDGIQRGSETVSTNTTIYSGCMMAVDAAGYGVTCEDTSGLRFDGVYAEANPTVLFTGDAAGAHLLSVKRPWRFTMAIAAAVVGDLGKAVYCVDNQTVGYTSSNSILVGWVDQVLSATSVLINPLYAPLSNVAVANNTLAFAGSTGQNTITMPDNAANALAIEEGSNVYVKFTTTNGSEVGLYGAPAATGVTSAGGAVQVVAGTGGTTSGTGGTVTIAAGAGGTGSSAAGGAVTITGGAGASVAGAGGAASLTGGAATAGNAAGGAAALIGGAGQGSSAGGAITITSGAAGSTGVAGAINISVGSAAAGIGSAVTISGGTGLGTTNGGGSVNLIGGPAASTGTPGEILVNSASGLGEVTWNQYLAAAVPVSGTSYGIYVANRAMRVKGVRCTCSSTGTVPTVDVIKDTGTTAPGGGTSVLTGVMTFNTTANTTVVGTVSTTIATVTMAAGDRLSLKWGGTIGSITGGIVAVLLEPC